MGHATLQWNGMLDPTANDGDADGDGLPDERYVVPSGAALEAVLAAETADAGCRTLVQPTLAAEPARRSREFRPLSDGGGLSGQSEEMAAISVDVAVQETDEADSGRIPWPLLGWKPLDFDATSEDPSIDDWWIGGNLLLEDLLDDLLFG